jgi:hypothetical protein
VTVAAIARREITDLISPPITFQGKSLTQLFVRAYVTAWWTIEAVVSGVNGYDVSVKLAPLAALCRGPDERSNHD